MTHWNRRDALESSHSKPKVTGRLLCKAEGPAEAVEATGDGGRGGEHAECEHRAEIDSVQS